MPSFSIRTLDFLLRTIPDRVISRIPDYYRVALETACLDLTTREPILVYQMGKVGSTTVVRTLSDLGLSNPIFHVHYLVPSNIRFREERRKRRGVLHEYSSRHLAVSRGLSWRVRRAKHVRWLLVTGVRDPIQRAISQIFEGASWRYPELFEDGRIQERRVLDLLAETIRPDHELIRETYDWMDEELNTAFDLDVYDHPFDVNAGHSSLRRGRLRLMLYRLGDLDRFLTEGLPRFLPLARPVRVRSANRSRDKDYQEIYRKVTSSFRISTALCRSIYDHAYMRHFYGPARTEHLVRKWTGRGNS